MNYELNKALGLEGENISLYDNDLQEHVVVLDVNGRPIYDLPTVLLDDNEEPQFDNRYTELLVQDPNEVVYKVGKLNDKEQYRFPTQSPCYLINQASGKTIYDENTPALTCTNIKGDEEVIFVVGEDEIVFLEDNSVPVFLDDREIYPSDWDDDYRVLWDEELEPHTVKKDGDGYVNDENLPPVLKDKDGEVVESTLPEPERTIFLDRKDNEVPLFVEEDGYPIFEEDTPIPVWKDGVIYYPKDFGNAVMMWDPDDKPVKIFLDTNDNYIFPKQGVNYPIMDTDDVLHDPYKEEPVDPVDPVEPGEDGEITYTVPCKHGMCSIEVTVPEGHQETSEDIMLQMAACNTILIEELIKNRVY